MSYSSEVLADSPRAFWRLNESSGSPVDSSGNSKTITFTASPTQESTGGPGSGDGAVLLNGTTQYLTSNVSMNDSDYTIELWYKGTANTGVLADCRGSTTGLYAGLGTPPVGSNLNGAPFIGVSASSIWRGRRSTSVVVNDNAWHHLAFVWDGTNGVFITTSQFTVYIDGVAVAMTDVDYAGQNAPINSSTDVFRFGHDTPFDTAWLAGRISNIALYNTPLSAARIAAHFSAGSSGSGSASLSLSGSGLASGAAVGSGALSLSGSGSAGSSAVGSGSLSLAGSGAIDFQPASGSGSLALSAAGGAGVGRTGSGSLSLSASGAASGSQAASGTGSLTLSGSGSATLADSGTAFLTLAATGAAEALYVTDVSNLLNGRNRRALATSTVTRPAAATPSRAAVKYDKSVPYPPPTLVNGRPT